MSILGRNWYFGYLVRALAVGLVLLGAAFLVACSGDEDTPATEAPQPTATAAPTIAATATTAPTATPAGPPVRVVATTNFVADWARAVGGDRVEVFGLLPVGGDPHSFQPGARDVAKVADADLVLTVGLGLEAEWLEDLVHNASADESKVVALGDFVDPLEFTMADLHDDHMDDHGDEGHDDHMDDGHGHAHGSHDPHFWFDPVRVKIAVNEIATRLAAIDRENASFYFENASNYWEQLDELHSWIQEQVGMVAPERRLLVTSHDSLSYFADLYGFEIVGLVIPSLAPDVEPSAEHIAGLVEVVREHNVPALFGETTVSERLTRAVAAETGANVVQLYSGSLGAGGSGAGTYLGMFRTNVERIVEALK